MKSVKWAVFAIAFLLLFPAVFVDASEEIIQFETGFFNQDRDTEMTINYADPEVSNIDLWDNRPAGAFMGASAPGNLYQINDWIVADHQTSHIGWFMRSNENILMAGASEFWIRGPVVADSAISATLRIYKLTDANFTFASLGTPMVDITVDASNHNMLGVHNGYTAQADAGEWAKIIAMGGTTTNPYLAYFHVLCPIYPNTYYWVEEEIEYNHAGTNFKPQVFLSSEDICADDIAVTIYNGTVLTNLPLDADFAVVFIAGQNGGRSMIKIPMSPGDVLCFSFDTTDPGPAWRGWVIPIYPDIDNTFWRVDYGGATAIANGTMDVGGFIISSNSAIGWVGFLVECTYLGSPTMEDINIYPPCIDSDTAILFRLESGTDWMEIDWVMGAMEIWSDAPISVNKTMNCTRGADVVDYEPYDEKPTVSIATGIFKNINQVIIRGIHKTVVFTGNAIGTIHDVYNDPLGATWSYLKWRMPSAQEAEDAYNRILNAAYNAYKMATDMFNETITWAVGKVGELVDRIQSLWQNGIDYIGAKINTLLEPIINFVHEIRDMISKVVEVIISALEYLITFVIKVVSIVGVITIPLTAISMFIGIKLTHKYTRRLDPTSKYYTGVSK